jgi:hypothetical protein
MRPRIAIALDISAIAASIFARPARAYDCGVDYDSAALAFTSDTANTKTGQIYDSDIKINALDFTWRTRSRIQL